MTNYLAPKAKEHVDQGGCAGDLCRYCDGEGIQRYPKGDGVMIAERCVYCNGGGLGR